MKRKYLLDTNVVPEPLRLRPSRTFLLAVVATTLVACGTTMYRPEYTIVVREARVPGRSGDAAVQTPASGGFSDDWLQGGWGSSERPLYLKLRNARTSPLWVRWDQASFVAVDGTRHAITLRGVTGTSPRPMAAQELSNLDLYPADYLVLEGGQEVEWKSTPLIPHMPGVANSDLARVESFARQQIGKSFRVELPVEASGSRRVYHFVFEVTGATPVQIRGT